MTISSSSSALTSSPGTQYADVARANKDSGDIARARQSRDSTAEQQAVAALRRDAPGPAGRDSENSERVQQPARERVTVGANLDVQA